MFIDKDKAYLKDINNSIKNEIGVFQRMGNVLHLNQRAIIMKCDREEYIPVVMDDCFSVVQSVASVWSVKKMTDCRRKEFPRAAVKMGLIKAPWLFRNKFYSKPETIELLERTLNNEPKSIRYEKFISNLSHDLLSDLPMALLVDYNSLNNHIINDVRTYIMSNSHIRIGALLWVFVTNTNSGNIKDMVDKEKISVTVI
ncbi:MAG: hypothetical protein JNL74_20250 [Fibrobacteres bacterium]|nr:hypothetical protein [Fibrobacterota bacterium]